LLSGGIDSPAAAFLMAKRGCTVDFIHFTAENIRQENAHAYKVSKLAQTLSKYTMDSRLYLVPYTHFEFELFGHKIFYELMIFRRFMTRTAEVLAESISAQAIITGDNLAQVASQTLENLVANSRATAMPILRPLITYDKMEIVDLAKQIGTYTLSLKPYKDCCSIVAKNPKTSSEDSRLESLEDDIFDDYDEVIRQTLDEAIILEYSCGERVK
jgi:thiamine biosynthesis protein ThiI